MPAATLRPLDRIRVIDLTTVLMGPVATQILADYGADVIKVEPPEGDVMRHAGAMRNPRMGPTFMHANRNKRSVVIDIRLPQGRDLVRELTAGADIFIHNIRPKVMGRLGLTYQDIAAVNPRILYMTLTGFGQSGPYAAKAAVDDVIQAGCGLSMLFAEAGGGEPRYVPSVLADRITGISAAHAALAALMWRQKTGEGQAIEVPMFETMAAAVLGDHMGGSSYEPATGPTGYNRLLTPNRRPYRTQDGYIAVLVYTDRHWRDFLREAGRHDLLDNPRYTDTAVRVKHYDEAYALVAQVLATRTTAQWLEVFNRIDVPCMPLHDIDSLVGDPHLSAVGFMKTEEHPTEGTVRTMRVPASWSTCDLSVRRPTPRLGEHTREVLLEAGLTDETVDRLLGEQVVRDQ